MKQLGVSWDWEFRDVQQAAKPKYNELKEAKTPAWGKAHSQVTSLCGFITMRPFMQKL